MFNTDPMKKPPLKEEGKALYESEAGGCSRNNVVIVKKGRISAVAWKLNEFSNLRKLRENRKLIEKTLLELGSFNGSDGALSLESRAIHASKIVRSVHRYIQLSESYNGGASKKWHDLLRRGEEVLGDIIVRLPQNSS